MTPAGLHFMTSKPHNHKDTEFCDLDLLCEL